MSLRNQPPEDERRALAEQLWSYGEDTLAPRAFDLTDEELQRLGKIAARPTEESILNWKALALAAVEVLEGSARPLARQKRRPLKDSPYAKGKWADALMRLRLLRRALLASPPGESQKL